MNQINDRPLNYDFGYDFNYALWTPGTELSLVNVPWNSDYRDIVRFDNRNALNAYIDSLEPAGMVINNVSYVKFGQPVRLDIPINRAMRYNYLRASNSLQPIEGDVKRDYYYFILGVNYIAPNTTELILQLDVVQTFIYDVQFGNCYVERGHIGIANENQFDNYGRNYLTVPEGLDIGGDYRIVNTKSYTVIPRNSQGLPDSAIIAVSTVDLASTGGTADAPERPIGPGTSINGVHTGATFYIFPTPDDLRDWLESRANKPWIAEGIISLFAAPNPDTHRAVWIESDIETTNPRRINSIWLSPNRVNMTSGGFRHSTMWGQLPSRYSRLKKFWTYPYSVIEVTTWSGSPVVLRPELWNNDDIEFISRYNILPPNQRMQFTPYRYNAGNVEAKNAFGLSDAQVNSLANASSNPSHARNQLQGTGDDGGEYLDTVTQIASFPSVPVVNNGALSYLASNQATIAHARASADWSQQRALQGASVQYGQAQRAIDTAYEQYQIGVTADAAQTANQNRTQAAQAVVSGIGGVVGGAAGGAMSGAAFGGGAGALAGAGVGATGAVIDGITNGINTGIGIAANDEALAIRTLAASRGITATTGQMQYVADTNNAYAQFAARGDYANTIAGINAKVQDAMMIQPSVAGQFGGDATNLMYGNMELSVRIKFIDEAAMRVIGEYWLRYGYAIRAFITPPANLAVMSKFTYWKMVETYLISSNVPETFKQTIRGIFEKGVTVWRNPGDIGTVDFGENVPLSGISY